MGFLQGIMKQIMDFFIATPTVMVSPLYWLLYLSNLFLPFSLCKSILWRRCRNLHLCKETSRKIQNDKERLNMEIMKLYQDNKVNPMGGCLPLFINSHLL